MRKLGLEVPSFAKEMNEEVVQKEYTCLIADPEEKKVKILHIQVNNTSTTLLQWLMTVLKFEVDLNSLGPPPEAVLDQIRSGFNFRRHVAPKDKQAPLRMGE